MGNPNIVHNKRGCSETDYLNDCCVISHWYHILQDLCVQKHFEISKRAHTVVEKFNVCKRTRGSYNRKYRPHSQEIIVKSEDFKLPLAG